MKTIGVIGLGSIAQRHIKNLKQLFPESDICVMSSSGRVPNTGEAPFDYAVANIETLIKHEPSFVIVASPSTFHAQHATKLLDSNIPVLVEKPVVSNARELGVLAEALEGGKAHLAVAYCLRYLSSAKEIQSLLSKGVVGDIVNVDIHIGQYLPYWRPNSDYRKSVSANRDLGGGALLELSHELDYAQWLFGDLKLQSAILRKSSVLNLDVEDIADLTFLTDESAVCTIHLDFLQRKAKRTCSIIGEKGRLDWDLIGNSIVFTNENENELIYSNADWDKNLMYLAMLEDFYMKVQGQSNQCIEFECAAKTVNLIDEIKKEGFWV